MKAFLASLAVLIIICAGCASRKTQLVSGPDYTYSAARQQLKGQAVIYPSDTMYDGNEQLKSAFLGGFKKGWTIAIEYWLGNAIAIPEEYRKTAELTKAWQDGCNAGQRALCERVRSLSALPSQ